MLSKAYPFYLWLLCVGVSIHISFCGMTYHVMTSHESNALLTSLTLSLSLDSQIRFQYY
jgi:hypothetical protein